MKGDVTVQVHSEQGSSGPADPSLPQASFTAHEEVLVDFRLLPGVGSDTKFPNQHAKSLPRGITGLHCLPMLPPKNNGFHQFGVGSSPGPLKRLTISNHYTTLSIFPRRSTIFKHRNPPMSSVL